MTTSIADFVEIKSESCPVCGHRGRCKKSTERGLDLVVCFRPAEADGRYRVVKENGPCAVFARIGSPADPENFKADRRQRPARPRPPRQPRYFDDIAERYNREITDGQVAELADELGVSAESLRTIHVGHTGQCPCFPERDADGNVIGINERRGPDAKPRYMVRKGDRRGLVVPDRLSELPDPTLIIEGPSDAAAALTMGLTAVGRPNDKGGADHLAKLLAGRDVLVIGENDQKSDGGWPGRDGAQHVARALATAWGKPVRWALPPEDTKDVRDYLLQNEGIDPHGLGRELLEHFVQAATAEAPEAEPEAKATPTTTSTSSGFARTDSGNAEALADRHGDHIRWSQGLDFCIYAAGRWTPDTTGEVHRMAVETIRAMHREAEKLSDAERKERISHALKSESDARIKAMLSRTRYLDGIAVDDRTWDRDPWRFNTSMATIEIDPETGEHRHREHDPADLITKLAPVAYDPEAKCPRFTQFLHEILCEDADLIQFAQRALGACLVGIPEEVVHVWYGIGENGKTTLSNALANVFGDYMVTMPQKFLAQKYGESVPHELMDLRGARLAISHEPDQRMTLDESKVKYITGRDEIKARRLYQHLVTFRPSHKLVLVTNHKPTVRTQTRAIWRRIKLWPFDFTVPPGTKDTRLPEKLKAEASGILNWLLAGCAEWVSAGRDCNPPEAIQAATVEYQHDEDVIADWLAERTEAAPERTAFKDLYDDYAKWATENDFKEPFSKRKLSALLEEHGFRRKTLHGNRVFEGLRLVRGDDGR